MYLLDERYASLIALLVGYDAAKDGTFFDEFQAWCAHKLANHDRLFTGLVFSSQI
jgi:hypothetical protein